MSERCLVMLFRTQMLIASHCLDSKLGLSLPCFNSTSFADLAKLQCSVTISVHDYFLSGG